MRVLVVGGAGVDTIVRVPALPPPAVDTLLVGPIERYLGHTGAGWALGLHTLGVPTVLLDVLGDDEEGAYVRRRLAADGLDLRVHHSPLGTRRSVNLVGPDGARSSFYDARDPGDLELDPALLDAALAGATHVHASIHDWVRPVLRRAVRDGLPVSTDLHSWDGEMEHHREFALAADVVTLSGAELADPESTARWIRSQGRARVVAVTLGGRGCAVLDDDGWHPVGGLALPDRPVLDSNGAGDAFGAALLAGLLHGLPPVAAARRGVIAGAWACGSAGTHAEPITGTRLDQILLDAERREQPR